MDQVDAAIVDSAGSSPLAPPQGSRTTTARVSDLLNLACRQRTHTRFVVPVKWTAWYRSKEWSPSASLTSMGLSGLDLPCPQLKHKKLSSWIVSKLAAGIRAASLHLPPAAARCRRSLVVSQCSPQARLPGLVRPPQQVRTPAACERSPNARGTRLRRCISAIHGPAAEAPARAVTDTLSQSTAWVLTGTRCSQILWNRKCDHQFGHESMRLCCRLLQPSGAEEPKHSSTPGSSRADRSRCHRLFSGLLSTQGPPDTTVTD